MANGDIAAATGLPVVPPTADIRMGYDEINLTRDEVATHMTTGTHVQARIVGLATTLAGKATKSAKGTTAVGVITSQQIGLRYENNLVIKVDTLAEFEVASRSELAGEIATIEARLAAHGI